MKTRNRDALAISSGACNCSGIARTLVQAIDASRADGCQPASDPAIRLIVSQLAYLCGVWDGVSEFAQGTFGECSRACEETEEQPQFRGWDEVTA